MKILSATQIKEADAFTIANEPIASIDLMERAASAFTDKFLELFDVYDKPITIICGIGNNGGDGLAIARLLHFLRAKPSVFIIGDKLKATEDFNKNYERLEATQVPMFLGNEKLQLDINKSEIVIDALFGIGLSRKLENVYKEVVECINQSGKTVVSVDMPSGLFCDVLNKENDTLICAAHTITFQQPKLSFLFPENEMFCGNVHTVNIGLNKRFYSETNSDYFISEKAEFLSAKVFHRNRFSHKGTFGHLLLVAGSKGKAGAAVLSAKSALRSGVGLLSILSAAANIPVLQTVVNEAMCLEDEAQNFITKIEAEFPDAFAIGPGIDTNENTADALLLFLKQNEKPLVLDADALNILAQQKEFKNLFPKECVITPHPKEFDRLTGKSNNSFERLQKARAFSKEHKVVVVLKGAHTAVVEPSGNVYFNSTGNAGMATAGSGDVLTGIVGSFLAQGLSALEAARLAVFLHGLAGDFAAKEKTEMALIAGDIIEFLPQAIKEMS
ncbi:MAG: hypothetical protein BGO32_13270 [Bacteroidetes bacterium 37-13]|nr:MAG: hypothetical protein BGO32_13270 [Bacteroidetes bacterium 37-13]